MEFIWLKEKSRVRKKILMHDKSREGLQVTNLKLQLDANCLVWIKDWIMTTNKKLLNLVGFNKQYGWRSQLFYNKARVDNTFLHHFVRSNLLGTWIRQSHRLREERPLWISPFEVIDIHVKNPGGKILTYRELIKVGSDGKKSINQMIMPDDYAIENRLVSVISITTSV